MYEMICFPPSGKWGFLFKNVGLFWWHGIFILLSRHAWLDHGTHHVTFPSLPVSWCSSSVMDVDLSSDCRFLTSFCGYREHTLPLVFNSQPSSPFHLWKTFWLLFPKTIWNLEVTWVCIYTVVCFGEHILFYLSKIILIGYVCCAGQGGAFIAIIPNSLTLYTG